ESWGDSEDKDEENDSDDISDEGDDDNDVNNGYDVRTKSDRIKIPILDHSTIEYYEEEEETIYDEETMYDDEDDEVTKELYEDVNVNLGNKDADMTDADLGGAD
ncbi:hypothetical protein Tco_0342610, partial [Tanacetum coccineum]